jgi:hypothetical protein
MNSKYLYYLEYLVHFSLFLTQSQMHAHIVCVYIYIYIYIGLGCTLYSGVTSNIILSLCGFLTFTNSSFWISKWKGKCCHDIQIDVNLWSTVHLFPVNLSSRGIHLQPFMVDAKHNISRSRINLKSCYRRKICSWNLYKRTETAVVREVVVREVSVLKKTFQWKGSNTY